MVQEFLKKQLIDELRISLIPVILGKGIRLFGDSSPEQWFSMKPVNSNESGLVQITYQVEPS